jgi:hypothetical protein
MRSLLLLPVVLSAGLAWGGADDVQALRELGPDKKVGICDFRLRGAARGGIPPAFLGIWGALKKDPKATPYSEELGAGFMKIYEDVLAKAGAFQLSPSEALATAATEKPQTLSDAAKENGLFACVKAESLLGVALGWKKKVNVTTEWELIGPSGWEIKIKTKATSNETQGMSPDTADPNLKPVFLQLARDSVHQFLEKLGESMKKAGCAAEIKMVGPDQALEGTLQRPPAPAAPPEGGMQAAKSDQMFIDNGDGTLTETQTGLMWAAKDNGSDISWDGARKYCEDYRGGGHSDWRMPTIAELRGLYDSKNSRKAACGLDVDITPRLELTCSRVWSSETDASTLARAALFDLEDVGSIARDATEYLRALPVRSAKK